MVKANYFDIKELVPRHVHDARGEKAWELIDSRLIAAIDAIRENHGPAIVNTWAYPKYAEQYGRRNWSGLRTAEFYRKQGFTDIQMYKAFERSYSQHKFGRAVDMLFVTASVDDVREDILSNPEKYPTIKAVELGTSWLHIDVRNCNAIKTFYP